MDLNIFIGEIISFGTIIQVKNGFNVVLEGIQGTNRKNIDVESTTFTSLANACYAVCDYFPNDMHKHIHFMYADGVLNKEYNP